jgi:hypothetical protein
MSEYYVGVTLTIAAVHAKHGREGFFRNTQLSSRTGLSNRIQRLPRERFLVFLKLAGGSELTVTAKPLHSRAGVLQEIVLSRRTANFGLEQLRWSCIVKRAGETS